MQSSEIKKILKKYKDVFDALENYDKTQELPFQRKRRTYCMPRFLGGAIMILRLALI